MFASRWLMSVVLLAPGLSLSADDPADRKAFLEASCAGDAALRERLENLLEAHAAAGGILDRPAMDPGATAAPTPEISEGHWHGGRNFCCDSRSGLPVSIQP